MRIHRHRRRLPAFKIPQFRRNEQITSPQVRLIDDQNEMLGVMDTQKAIELAKSREMDLLEVSPKAKPPVCKIMDYGQFKYEKEKEAKKQKAQSKEVDLKGIRLTFRIGQGDLDVRKKQGLNFLSRGDKLKIELVLRGREKGRKDLAKQIIDGFIASLQEEYPLKIEQAPIYQGGRMISIVARA